MSDPWYAFVFQETYHIRLSSITLIRIYQLKMIHKKIREVCVILSALLSLRCPRIHIWDSSDSTASVLTTEHGFASAFCTASGSIANPAARTVATANTVAILSQKSFVIFKCTIWSRRSPQKQLWYLDAVLFFLLWLLS